MFWPYVKLALAAQETAVASMITINQRLWRFSSGDASASFEAMTMIIEKQAAFNEAALAFNIHTAKLFRPGLTPQAANKIMTNALAGAIKPYQRKSSANARRLTGKDQK